jgi:hypothetical protein
MRKAEEVRAWVVYRMRPEAKQAGRSAVCAQAEWEAMELARPGYYALIRAGITSEGEAEALAREASGFVPPAASRPTVRA